MAPPRLPPPGADAYIGIVYTEAGVLIMSQSQTQEIVSNPFALMMDPAAVFAAIESSDRLARLHSRVCRPLDKPQPVPAAAAETSIETAAFDKLVDSVADTEY